MLPSPNQIVTPTAAISQISNPSMNILPVISKPSWKGCENILSLLYSMGTSSEPVMGIHFDVFVGEIGIPLWVVFLYQFKKLVF